MAILILICLLGLVLFGITQGFMPPPNASTLIRIRDGAVEVRRGQVRSDTREQIREILSEAGVSKGFIAITPQNWVGFSRHIPLTARQRLRNVLLNQWT